MIIPKVGDIFNISFPSKNLKYSCKCTTIDKKLENGPYLLEVISSNSEWFKVGIMQTVEKLWFNNSTRTVQKED